MTQVPNLDIAKWIAQCGNTPLNSVCTRTNTACALGVGTISATCTSSGWSVAFGYNRCGDTCAVAPSNIRTTAPNKWYPDIWNSICGSTKRGVACFTSDACTPNGFVNATCGPDLNWVNVDGGCF